LSEWAVAVRDFLGESSDDLSIAFWDGLICHANVLDWSGFEWFGLDRFTCRRFF